MELNKEKIAELVDWALKRYINREECLVKLLRAICTKYNLNLMALCNIAGMSKKRKEKLDKAFQAQA